MLISFLGAKMSKTSEKNRKVDKIVNKRNDFTNSGIKPSSNTNRTLQLSELALARSARLKRLTEAMGVRSIKDLSKITDMANGTVTRLSNASVCMPLQKAFQISASAFKNNHSDSDYNKDAYYASPDWLLHGIGEEPQKIKTNKDFDLEEFLSSQFNAFDDSYTRKLSGLLERDDIKSLSMEEQALENKNRTINIFLTLDLFRAGRKNAFIAYPSELYMNTSQRPIVGFIAINTKEELLNLNGKECVVILKQGDVPVIRKLDILNNQILLSTPNHIGSMIISADELPHKIGSVAFLILDEQMQLLRKVTELMCGNEYSEYEFQMVE